jgi:hypothetical protein
MTDKPITQPDAAFEGFIDIQTTHTPSMLPSHTLLAIVHTSSIRDGTDQVLDVHGNTQYLTKSVLETHPVYVMGRRPENVITDLEEARDSALKAQHIAETAKATAEREAAEAARGLKHCEETLEHFRETRNSLSSDLRTFRDENDKLREELKKARAHFGDRAWKEALNGQS